MRQQINVVYLYLNTLDSDQVDPTRYLYSAFFSLKRNKGAVATHVHGSVEARAESEVCGSVSQR